MGSSDDIEDGADAMDMSVEDFKGMPRGVLVGTVKLVDCDGDYGDFEWSLENPVRFREPLVPNPEEKPQPIWFYPFGRPETAKGLNASATAKKKDVPGKVAKKKVAKRKS